MQLRRFDRRWRIPYGSLMVVEMEGDPSHLEPGPPRRLFQTRTRPTANQTQYAVTADGQRFLVLAATAEESQAPLTVVVNWTAGLER